MYKSSLITTPRASLHPLHENLSQLLLVGSSRILAQALAQALAKALAQALAQAQAQARALVRAAYESHVQRWQKKQQWQQ